MTPNDTREMHDLKSPPSPRSPHNTPRQRLLWTERGTRVRQPTVILPPRSLRRALSLVVHSAGSPVSDANCQANSLQSGQSWWGVRAATTELTAHVRCQVLRSLFPGQHRRGASAAGEPWV